MLKTMGATELEVLSIDNFYYSVAFGKPDIEGLKEIMPYCVHFHGKFYSFDNDGNEASNPYNRILPIKGFRF